MIKKRIKFLAMVPAIALCSCASSNVDAPAQIVPSLPIPFLKEAKVVETPEEQAATISANKLFYGENKIYQRIADGVASRGALSTQYQLLGARYTHEAFRRTILPQITPTASVDDVGNITGRLQIEQVLFDGGRFKAGNRVLNAQQAIAFSEYAIQFNERVGIAIDAYLRQDMHAGMAEISAEVSALYKTLKAKASRRLAGGVGSKVEHSLFELKQFEVETEAARDIAEADAAKLELEKLIGEEIDTPPPLISFEDESAAVPPVVALAIAESKKSAGELYAERAERLPQFSVRGSVGAGTNQGLGFNDRINSFSAGVRLSKPLTWGRDYGLKAAGAQARASRAVVREAQRDADVQLKTLSLRISSLSAQLIKAEKLEEQSRARIDSFEEQFLGGGASITQAVGIIDTYRRIVRNKVDIRFALLSAQREKVQLLGLLGPYASTRSLKADLQN